MTDYYTIVLRHRQAQFQHHDARETAPTLDKARRIAADMLGAKNLRGAARWETTNGIAYGFGPRTENNGYEWVEIEFGDGDDDDDDRRYGYRDGDDDEDQRGDPVYVGDHH